MTRKQMIAKIMKEAREASGLKASDPMVRRARREVERNSDAELALLCRGIDSGAIYTAVGTVPIRNHVRTD